MVTITADKVIVELEAKLDAYNARVLAAERNFTRSMGGIQRSVNSTEKVVSFASRAMITALGGIGAVAVAKGLLSIADAAKQMEAQLRLATAQSGNLGRAQEDVRRISAETRSDLSTVADLYGKFQRNSLDLGITQAESARATETLAKTFKISGAAASEESAAIRQFSQALASGVLRGDEFNSIMENSPRLARLLAESLGVPVGALRQMAEEGQLTADKLVQALTDQRFTKGIDDEFKQLPVTFDQAMSQVRNAAVITFGAFDQGGEFSDALANFVLGGSDGFEDLERSAEDFGIAARGNIEGLGEAFQPVLDTGIAIFDALGVRVADFAADGRASIASLLGSIDQAYNSMRLLKENEFSLFGMATGMTGTNVPRSTLQQDFLRGAAQSDRERRLDRGLDRIFANGLGIPKPEGSAATRVTPAAKANRGRKGPRGPSAETLARREEAARLRAERNEAAFQADLARFNEDLLAAKQALVTAADAVAAYELQMLEVERSRVNEAIRADVIQKKLTQAQADQLIALNDQVAAGRAKAVQLVEQERIRQEQVDVALAGLDNEMDLAGAQEQLARTAEERRSVALRLLDLQYEQERLELEAVIASRDASNAQKEIARARLGILGQLKASDAENIRLGTAGPMEGFLNSIPNTAEEINESLEAIRVGGIQSVIDGLGEVAAEYVKLGGVAGQVVNQIISQLVRLALQQAVLGIFGGAANPNINGPNVFGRNPTGGAKGMALGGSMLIGGRGGIDQNTLSINGRPVAKVSRNESLHVVPQGRSFDPIGGRVKSAAPVIRNYNISVSADNSVTPAGFAKGLASQILQEAQRMDAQASAMTLKAVPGRLFKYQTDGT